MTKKIAYFTVIFGMGYLAWAGSFSTGRTVHAREKQNGNASETPVIRFLRTATASNSDQINDATPTPNPAETPTPSPSPTATPEQKPSGARQLALGIIDFFKGPPKPSAPMGGQRGLNMLGSNPQSSPYPAAGTKKSWYVAIGVLALLGGTTFAYGRTKHIG